MSQQILERMAPPSVQRPAPATTPAAAASTDQLSASGPESSSKRPSSSKEEAVPSKRSRKLLLSPVGFPPSGFNPMSTEETSRRADARRQRWIEDRTTARVVVQSLPQQKQQQHDRSRGLPSNDIAPMVFEKEPRDCSRQARSPRRRSPLNSRPDSPGDHSHDLPSPRRRHSPSRHSPRAQRRSSASPRSRRERRGSPLTLKLKTLGGNLFYFYIIVCQNQPSCQKWHFYLFLFF